MLIKRLTSARKPALLREGAPLLGLYWIYSSIRWFVARDTPYEAFENAFKIIQLEKELGIFLESALQDWLIDHALGLVHIANAFYTFGYFPVLILFGVFLFRFEPDRFQVFRQSFLLGLGFALICFSLFPLAPPRMLPGVGFVDTQGVYSSGLYNHKLVLSFYNPYAAMPSLHFGWAMLVGIVAWGFDRRLLKAMGLVYPSFMALVIVITGHHYFLDIIGGGIVVGVAYALVRALPYVAEALRTPHLTVPDSVSNRTSSHTLPAAHSNEPHISDGRYGAPESMQHQDSWPTFITYLINRTPPL